MKARQIVPILLLLGSTCSEAATLVVRSVADAGSGSLREAITSANQNPGLDTIAFAIPGDTVHVIALRSQLPPLSDALGAFVDGFTQRGAGPGAAPPRSLIVRIVLDGSDAGAACGLVLSSSGNTVRGIAVINFQRDGIRVQATGAGTTNNLVSASFIGVDALGRPAGNGVDTTELWAGVSITSASMLPVLTSAFDNAVSANIISANLGVGVAVRGAPPTLVYQNTIESNWIGSSPDAVTPFGNRVAGILIENGASATTVSANVIGGNGGDGVAIVGHIELPVLQWWSHRNVVAENRIGYNPDGCPMANAGNGVSIGMLSGRWHQGFASHNSIRLNAIAYNLGAGVAIWENPLTSNNADSNVISWNSIHHNHGIGIDLGDDGPTPNDPLDADVGANSQLNTPEIDSAVCVSDGVEVHGRCDTVRGARVVCIELFLSSSEGDTAGEGISFLATTAPDASGTWRATVIGLVAGDVLTATATDACGSTSEFSTNVKARAVTTAAPYVDDVLVLNLR